MAASEDSTAPAADPLRGVAPGLLALIGLGFGASVFAEGYYDIRIWGPIAIGMLALLLVLVVGAPARLRGPAAAAVAALVVLWLWSWISASWAESDEQSHIATARWAMYAATFGVLLLLLRDGRHRRLLLAFTGAGVLAVALYVALSMLGGEGRELFFGGRLRDPLGYPNGQAGYFLVGLWPFIALAERARNPVLAGVGIAGALLLACMLLMGQARGVLPGVAVSAVVILLLVPGRGRRLWVLIAAGAALAIVAQPLLDIYQAPVKRGEFPPEALVQDAARAMLLGAGLLGILWAAVQYLISGPLRRATERRPRSGLFMDRLATGVAVVIVAVVALGALAVVDDPVGKVERQYDEFVNLKVENQRTDARFFSGGGYRYDYWRIAWEQFKDRPLKGVGAGSYDRTYFLERQTSEDIRQPHSLELQILGETGLVGGLALLAFILAVLGGLWRQSRIARDDDWERAVAVACGGAFIAWLAHTSVDWLHNMPGVTGIALVAAAALLSPWVSSARSGPRGRARLATAAVAGVAALAAVQTVAKPTGTEVLRQEAQDQLASDPVKALERANQALSLQGDSLRALFARSAAYARLERYGKAHAALLEAARLEPHDHLPWALLGDLATRRGELAAAKRYYRRSARLNPRYSRLQELAKNPRMALLNDR